MDTDGEPKKYIRTLEGDIEALKKGGARDRAPLPPEKPETVPLETYEGDFLDRVRETRASTATVLAAEQDESPRAREQAPPEKISRKNLFYGIAGGALIIAGIVGAYFAYTRYLAASAPLVLAPSAAAPIFVDEREAVSGAGLALIQAIGQSVKRPLASGGVRLLYLEAATSTAVFSALRLSAPGALLRNIVIAESMAGVVNPAPGSAFGTGGVQSPFFILSVATFGDTFAGMLAWETAMPRDLIRLFPPFTLGLAGQFSATSTSATSTPLAPPVMPAFRDEVVANHDVRVYRDAGGKSVMLYGYWNQTTLVIARDPSAFTEIIGRLATSRAQ